MKTQWQIYYHPLTMLFSVVWFNLGMHHVAHTGDLPNTISTTAQGSMMISPHNYLDLDASRKTSQMVEINFSPSSKGETTIKEFGKSKSQCFVDTVCRPRCFASEMLSLIRR